MRRNWAQQSLNLPTSYPLTRRRWIRRPSVWYELPSTSIQPSQAEESFLSTTSPQTPKRLCTKYRPSILDGPRNYDAPLPTSPSLLLRPVPRLLLLSLLPKLPRLCEPTTTKYPTLSDPPPRNRIPHLRPPNRHRSIIPWPPGLRPHRRRLLL